MLMLGTYLHSLDPKGRLTIPARFRDELTPGIVITKGIGNYLELYPHNVFEVFAKRVEGVPVPDRDLARYVFANASYEVPDRQGRILIPQMLREHAHLTPNGEVLIAGVGNHLEIWNRELWDAKMAGITTAMLEEKLIQYGI